MRSNQLWHIHHPKNLTRIPKNLVFTLGNYRSKLSHVPSSLFAWNCLVVHINSCRNLFTTFKLSSSEEWIEILLLADYIQSLQALSLRLVFNYVVVLAFPSAYTKIQTIVNRLMLVESRTKYIVFTLITQESETIEPQKMCNSFVWAFPKNVS